MVVQDSADVDARIYEHAVWFARGSELSWSRYRGARHAAERASDPNRVEALRRLAVHARQTDDERWSVSPGRYLTECDCGILRDLTYDWRE